MITSKYVSYNNSTIKSIKSFNLQSTLLYSTVLFQHLHRINKCIKTFMASTLFRKIVLLRNTTPSTKFVDHVFTAGST